MLQTPRLVLRRHRLEDFADSLAMWSDSAVTCHIGGRPQSAEEVWARLLRYAGHWALLGFGYWVVCNRSDGHFVGEVGFADYRRDITPSFDGAPELGWALLPSEHRRGLATEAVSAALAWGDARWPKTVCMIAPDNVASLRVAEKAAFAETARTTYKSQPAVLFARIRPPG